MILKSIAGSSTQSAPITYFFDDDHIRLEVFYLQESNQCSLCITACERLTENLIAKTTIDSIFPHNIQYHKLRQELVFQSNDNTINIFSLADNTMNIIEYEQKKIHFEIAQGSALIAVQSANRVVSLTDRVTEQTHQLTGIDAYSFQNSTLFCLKSDGFLHQIDLYRDQLLQTKLFRLPVAAGIADPKLKAHPSSPIIAFCNNQFSLAGERFSISLFNRETQALITTITRINRPVRALHWWTDENKIILETSLYEQQRIRIDNQYALEVINLNNLHEHYQLTCYSKPIQISIDTNSSCVRATHLNECTTWTIPARQSKKDNLSLHWKLTNGVQININGVRLLKILHSSVQAHITPFVRLNRNTDKTELRQITNGLGWLKLAGRMATQVSGEIASRDDCKFVKNKTSKLTGGNIVVGLAAQQTRVSTTQEHVSIPHSNDGSYVEIARYINQFLDQLSPAPPTAAETYQQICSVLNNDNTAQQNQSNTTHADLAKTLLARLSLTSYPEHFTTQNREFFDSLLVLLFGMEASRVNSSYLTGIMMLDLIANHVTFGRFQRTFSWQNIFTSGPGYQWNDFEQRDYGGKYPLASNSTGPGNFQQRTTMLQDRHEQLALNHIVELEQNNQVAKKEIKVLLAWLNNLNDQHIESLCSAKNEQEFIGLLTALFKNRLQSVFRNRPTIPVSFLRSNEQEYQRQHELRTRSQQLTGSYHYYLKTTRSNDNSVRWDQHYHRVDVPCKMVASDFVAGNPKVISQKRQRVDTTTEPKLSQRKLSGVTKTFNIATLTDLLSASDNTRIESTRRSMTITPTTSELVSDTFMRMLIGREKFADYAHKRRKRDQIEPPPLNEGQWPALHTALGKCIKDFFMPHFDFFADVLDDPYDDESDIEKIKIKLVYRSKWTHNWLRLIQPNTLYAILTSLLFGDSREEQGMLTATLSLQHIIQVIRQHAAVLPDDKVQKLAESILETIANILITQSLQVTATYIPNCNTSNPLFPQSLHNAFTQTSHLLLNNPTFQLGQEILSKITSFRIDRQFSVKNERLQELAPCPRCYSESAPAFPGIAYDYNQTVCLVAEGHPQFHRIPSNPENQHCQFVDSMHGVIQVGTNKPPTMVTFVKHARETLGKQACMTCWLPLPRAQGEHRDDESPKPPKRGRWQMTRPSLFAPNHTQLPKQNRNDRSTSQQQQTQPNRDTDAKALIATNIKRLGLFNSETKSVQNARAMLVNKIGGNYHIGEAMSEGDCFYDSMAQGINNLFLCNEHSAKSLRKLCFDTVQSCAPDSPQHQRLTQFIKNESDLANYKMNVQFCADEVEAEGIGTKYAIWGVPVIDGQLICDALGINLHVTEVREDDVEGETLTHISHRLIIPNKKSKILEAKDVPPTNTIHIANWRQHFVPMFEKTLQQVHDTSLKV